MSEDLTHLSIADLMTRLRAAEDVCLMFGWTPSKMGDPNETERDKALHELWSRWSHLVPGREQEPRRHPHLSDEAISQLAADRDATRERTLQRRNSV